MSVAVVPVAAEHRARWEALYAGYAAFYKVEQTEAMRATVWGWLMDPAHEVKGLVALLDGKVVGLIHYRPFARPLRAAYGTFADDLFVDPACRGQRVADALLLAVKAEAKKAGHNVVRWITADDNYRGRGVYDRVGTRTMWITYDMPL